MEFLPFDQLGGQTESETKIPILTSDKSSSLGNPLIIIGYNLKSPGVPISQDWVLLHQIRMRRKRRRAVGKIPRGPFLEFIFLIVCVFEFLPILNGLCLLGTRCLPLGKWFLAWITNTEYHHHRHRWFSILLGKQEFEFRDTNHLWCCFCFSLFLCNFTMLKQFIPSEVGMNSLCLEVVV